MSNNIDIQFTVEDAAAFKSWQRQQAAAAKMKKELDALKNSGNQAGAAIAGIGGKAVGVLKDAGAQLLGVGSAVSALLAFAHQLIAEIENVKRKNKAAGQANVGIVPSLNTASQNAGGAMTDPQILSMAKKTSEQTSQKVSKVLDTFGAMWAAGAPANEAEARAAQPAVAAVLKTFPSEDAETTAQIASVTKSLMVRFKLSAEEAIGYYLKSAEGNFSRGNAALSKHAIPAGIRGTAFGDSPAESQGIVNVFSQSMQDADAAQSSHAANVFQEQLRERLPDLPNTQKRVEYLRAHPEEAKAYLEGGTIAGKKFDAAKKGEGGSIATIEGILGINKTPAFAGLYEEMKGASEKIVAAGADRKGLADRQAAQVRSNLSTGPQVLAAQERQVESAKELQQLADAEAAAKGIAAEGFDKIMESSDLSLIQQWAKSQAHFFTGGGAGNLADEMDRLAERQDMMQIPDNTQNYTAGFGGGSQIMKTVPNPNATDEQKIKAAQYRAAAKRIRELEAQRKEGVNATNKEDVNGLTIPNAMKNARQAAQDIEADKNITPQDVSAARGNIQAARDTVNAAQGSLSDQAIRDLKGEILRLSQVIEANIKATEKNTTATAGSGSASGTRSASMIPARPRGGQNTRQFNRGAGPLGGGTQMS